MLKLTAHSNDSSQFLTANRKLPTVICQLLTAYKTFNTCSFAFSSSFFMVTTHF